ncbi:structural protein [Vibrio phage VpP2 MP]
MAYQKGTASSHTDLLVKLHTFATANGWTAQKNEESGGERELVLKSTGTGGNDSIVLAFRTNTLQASDTYNIRCRVSAAYVTSAFDNITGASPESVMYAWNADMEYYFIVSKERILILFTVSGVSQYYYGGNLQVYTSRGHWVSPLCCFGVGTSNTARWSEQGNDFSGWQYIRGSNPNHLLDDTGVWTKPDYLFPNMDTALTGNMRAYDNGDIPLLPMFVRTAARGIVGELHGAFGCGGFGVSHGQELTHSSGRRFVILQNVYRAGTTDYMAMELS